MTDDEAQDLSRPIFEPFLGGTPPKVVIPKQIDTDAMRNLLNHFYTEYHRAASELQAAGDEKQSAYMNGVCAGIRIAYERSLELERFVP